MVNEYKEIDYEKYCFQVLNIKKVKVVRWHFGRWGAK